MRKSFLILSILSLLLFFSPIVVAEDSIPAQDLQELVVKSERSWIENGVVNIIPSKKEKQLSTSPGSLISIMHLPMLKGEGENITTANGEDVAIFINGEPANQTDLATFWPKNVKKVEYMTNPTGGQYTGNRYVVNFIVSDYEVGGVTRLYARQSYPLDGVYRVSSKLNYKKMSYGLMVNGNEQRKRPDKLREEAIYKDIFFKGSRYDEISQISNGETKNRWSNWNLAFNARYTTDKVNMTHTFGLRWNKSSSQTTTGNIWSESIFNSDDFSSFFKNKSLSPQISGKYHFTLPGKWSLGGSWNYAFSSNNNTDWTQFGGDPRVDNTMDERVNTLSAYVYLNYAFSSKLTLQLHGASSSKWFDSEYKGSVTSDNDIFREDINAKLSAFWDPSSNFSFVGAAGLDQSIYKFSGSNTNHIEPNIYLYGRWNPNRKLSMNITGISYFSPVSAAEGNPVMIKKSDLFWVTGNPDLKPRVTFMGYYSLLYMPTSWFSLSPSIVYQRYLNYPTTIYEAASEEMGGIIETKISSAPYENTSMTMNTSFYLFNNRLSISLSPQVNIFKSRGVYARSLTYFSMDANVGYMLGNCYFNAVYQGKKKVISPGGTVDIQDNQYWFSLTYAYKDLNIGVTVENPFNSRLKFESRRLSDVYATNSFRYSPGRGVTLSLTYTFGYGKKIDRMIDITAPSEVESSQHTGR